MEYETMKTDCDVLIVGAGPVGLTLAVELQRFGLACRIVDQCAKPTDKSKALVVWPRTLELLDRAGIADKFVAAGMWAKGARMFGGGKQLVHIEVHLEDTAYPGPLMIAQNETERLLNETLTKRGLPVERSVELLHCEDHGNYVTSTLRHADGHEEQVTSAWIAGCDGSHSTVRKQIGVDFKGEFEPNDWILADTHIDGPLTPNEISAYWHADGVAIFFPFSTPGRYRVICDMGAAPSTGKPADPTLEQVQKLVDERGPSGLRLHDPIWLSGFRIHERKVDEYAKGRAFLCGDAAHIHSPAGGQGMNTGMQDAFNLAWKLALVHQGHARPSLLKSYTQERNAVGEMVLHNAGIFTRVATIRNPVLQSLRNHLISIAGKFSAVQQRAVSQLTELAIHYANSPLNGDDPGKAWSGKVAAGDRLPEAELTCGDSGKATRMLSAIGGEKHTLLVMPQSTADAARRQPVEEALLTEAQQLHEEFGDVLQVILVLPHDASGKTEIDLPSELIAGVYIDSKNQLRDRLGLRNTAIALVRPDGYIGFRGNEKSHDALHAHLEKYLLPSPALVA
jgi:2-polyprenyl-6-methoxyphenol hydroxylase-like FAD-dependent oxidoreductase